MRHVPFVLTFTALASVGCATNSGASHELAAFSAADLAAPVETAPSSAWSEADLSTAVVRSAPAESSSAPSAAAALSNHITMMGGKRWLDDDWEPLDEPYAFGLEFDHSSPSGHGYEVGALYTNEDDDLFSVPGIGTVSAETTTYELYAGYRYTFNADETGLHPFVSAGLNAEYGELELSAPGTSTDDDDTAFGGYARAGLLLDIGERLRLGLDYRHLFTQDLEVFDTDFNSDYDQVMLTLGWAF
jgi:hypothetical protein